VKAKSWTTNNAVDVVSYSAFGSYFQCCAHMPVSAVSVYYIVL